MRPRRARGAQKNPWLQPKLSSVCHQQSVMKEGLKNWQVGAFLMGTPKFFTLDFKAVNSSTAVLKSCDSTTDMYENR